MIATAARSSPLSRVQVKEVEQQMGLSLEPRFFSTMGDLDRKTSLRSLDKTDFFTKEIDEALLNGECRIAIHSAKDLPDPLPEGLMVVALTKGVDPSDSLVGQGPKIATSSERREEAVKKLIPDATFVDIRGTIHERLQKVESGEVDGVVIAEAALIRLGLTHLKRLRLPGETTEFQGQLAILAREGDLLMQELFSKIDVRTILHTGLTRPKSICAIHSPLIEIVPKAFLRPSFFTHVVYTSKTAVRLFPGQKGYAVGRETAKALEKSGGEVLGVAEEETAEGLAALLEKQNLEGAHLFWPHSAKSRDVLPQFFREREIAFTEAVAYDTVARRGAFLPPLEKIDEIVFTSPSTVKAFRELYGALPKDKKLSAIGPVTEEALGSGFRF